MPNLRGKTGGTEKAAIRAGKALELRIRGLSYRRIGEALGVDPKTAHRDVTAEMAKVAIDSKESAEAAFAIELERLDDAIVRVANSDAYKMGDPQSINAMIRLSESRRKLLGLDAPARQDVTSGGEKIQTYTVVFPSDLDAGSDTDGG